MTILPLFLLASVADSLSRPDAHLSEDERTELLSWFDESKKAFAAAISDLADDQWKWKPAAGRWSVGETAEHIVLAEALLFGFVRRALATPANPAWKEETRGKTELLIRKMPSRQSRALAPEPFIPKEGLTRAQVVRRFELQRTEILSFTRETRLPLKQHTLVHPFPVLGTLNAYQWLIYVPLHTLRHQKQITEIKITPGYPANGLFSR